jgi:N-acetyl-alpha-D-glucosaminyl L-malate synthase BshA
MARITKQESLDLIHVHYSIPHSSAAFLAREQTGKPYVVTLHGSDVTLLGSDPAYELVNTMTVEKADAITAVSEFMSDEARNSLGIERYIKFIPNFVDTEEFHPASYKVLDERSGRDIVVIHVSNFRKVKRIEDLIYAMKIVTKQAPDSKLLLVGDGPERYNIESLVRELDLKENVLLTGYRSDVADLLRCADVLVLCSQTESAPLTVLEAMSSGVPVVATKVGGIPEIIKDSQNGYLVPVKNPEEIAEKLVLLNNSPENIRRLGKNARKSILEKFSIDKVLNQYEEVYDSIVG